MIYKTEGSTFNFLEIPVKRRFNEDDTVEKLLHDNILTLVVQLGNTLQLDLCLSANCCLNGRRGACTLEKRRVRKDSLRDV